MLVDRSGSHLWPTTDKDGQSSTKARVQKEEKGDFTLLR